MKPTPPSGPSRISSAFARCGSQDQAALITYVMGGDPDVKTSLAMALACEKGGADILEIGVPFSDPIADGPILQAAAQRALAKKTTLATCLDLVAALRRKSQIPVALMGYFNPILSMGEAAFLERCDEVGVDAVIIPDLPPDEASQFRALAARTKVRTCFLLAPTSTPAREQAACEASTGFVYYVSLTGVTGVAKAQLSADISERIAAVRQRSSVPVVVGFGISAPEQAKAFGHLADGVVVGSALVARVAEGGTTEARAARVTRFVRDLKRALSSKVS